MRNFLAQWFFMQTNAISSNLVRYRKKLCETPKHDRILMYTNWMALSGNTVTDVLGSALQGRLGATAGATTTSDLFCGRLQRHPTDQIGPG